MAKWVIRTGKGKYLDTIEAPNSTVASNKAWGKYWRHVTLTVQSEVSDQIRREETHVIERRRIMNELEGQDRARALDELRKE